MYDYCYSGNSLSCWERIDSEFDYGENVYSPAQKRAKEEDDMEVHDGDREQRS